MTYATFKFNDNKTPLSIFGVQKEGKIEIFYYKFNKKDKIFSNKKGWEYFEQRDINNPNDIINGINQEDFLRYCRKNFYKRKTLIINSSYKIIDVKKTKKGKVILNCLVK